jgi:repressor LexA
MSGNREKILTLIRDFRAAKGYSPTVREIAEQAGITSTSVVQYHLDRLERDGAITRQKDKFRSILLPDDRAPRTEVPLLGTIAAGQPVWVPAADAWASAERVSVPADAVAGKTNIFALRVRGNSMVDAMIAEGDIVLMEQPRDVRNGDVVAAWLKNEQEVTLKKIYYEEGRVRLQPCNPYMLPIWHKATNVEVQGRVIAVIRLMA